MGRRRSFFTQKNLEAMAKHPAYACSTFIIFGIVSTIIGALYIKSIFEIAIYGITVGPIMILFGIFIAYGIYTDKKEYEEKLEKLAKANIYDIDQMTGRQFEQFLLAIYTKLGYEVTLTKTTGDYGADLILKKDFEDTAVQAKHSKNKISISSVQEVIGAISYYNSNRAIVITNNYFTKPARVLADSNAIILIDRDGLAELICQVNKDTETGDETKKEIIETDFQALINEAYDNRNCEKMWSLINQAKEKINDLETLHYIYNNSIAKFYGCRKDYPQALEYVDLICKWDVELLDKNYTLIGSHISYIFNRKIIDLTNEKRYLEALEFCNKAIFMNLTDPTYGSFIKRKEKIEKYILINQSSLLPTNEAASDEIEEEYLSEA